MFCRISSKWVVEVMGQESLANGPELNLVGIELGWTEITQLSIFTYASPRTQTQPVGQCPLQPRTSQSVYCAHAGSRHPEGLWPRLAGLRLFQKQLRLWLLR